MEEYLREDGYIRLIQCFLNPELMLKKPEPRTSCGMISR